MAGRSAFVHSGENRFFPTISLKMLGNTVAVVITEHGTGWMVK